MNSTSVAIDVKLLRYRDYEDGSSDEEEGDFFIDMNGYVLGYIHTSRRH